MKKYLVLSLVLSLMLLVTGSASAAVHNFTGDFTNPFLLPDFSRYGSPLFEGWYYIEKDNPSVTVRGLFPKNGNVFGFEYFQNDQTFIDVTHVNPDSDNSSTCVKGSYLFDNGFFAGLDYGSNGDVSQTTLSPGYRFNFDDNGYIAASLDYAVNDQFYRDSGIVDYELTARYYTDQFRVYGNINIPNDKVVGTDQSYLWAGGAYKFSDNVVLGANYRRLNDINSYDIGCSATFDRLGAEVSYSDGDAGVSYSTGVNLVYSFTDNFRAGFQTTKVENLDDLYWLAKLKYTVDDKNAVVLMHQLKNEAADMEAVTYLRWDIALK
jgi:hypothetical protein